jgi:hypothetical protein
MKEATMSKHYRGLALALATYLLATGCSNMLATAQDAEAVTEAKANLSITSATGDLTDGVTGDLTLPTALSGVEGATVTWSASPEGYVDASTGAVTRPAYGSGDVTVTLTATIVKGSMTMTQSYEVTVLQKSPFAYTVRTAGVTIDGLSEDWESSSLEGKYSLAIPSTLEGSAVIAIGGKAFYDQSGITSISIPDSVKSIGSYAFYGCSSLTQISLPSSLTSIASDCFYKCEGLTAVAIPEGVTTIGPYAFYGCGGLTQLSLPSTVTSIGNYAFNSCYSLASMSVSAIDPPTLGSTYSLCDSLRYIYVPKASVAAYQSASYWAYYKKYICEPSSGSISLIIN